MMEKTLFCRKEENGTISIVVEGTDEWLVGGLKPQHSTRMLCVTLAALGIDTRAKCTIDVVANAMELVVAFNEGVKMFYDDKDTQLAKRARQLYTDAGYKNVKSAVNRFNSQVLMAKANA